MKKMKMTFYFWTSENDWMMICNDFTVWKLLNSKIFLLTQ